MAVELREFTVAQLLEERGRLQGEDPAYFFENGVHIWREVDDMSDRVALALLELGVIQGGHVGLWGVNTYAWIICYYAVRKLGAVAVLFNASCQMAEIQSLLDYSDVTVLLVGEEKPRDHLSYQSMVPGLKRALPKLKLIRTMKELLESAQQEMSGQCERMKILRRIKQGVSAHETASLIFTSGTTSHPKGVMLNDFSMLNNSAAICERMQWTRGDRMLLASPFYHCSGTTAGFLLGLYSGFSSVVVRYFDSLKIMQSIEQYHCTVFNVVPSMLLMLMKKQEFGWYDLSSYCSGTIAGSMYTRKQYDEMCQAFHLKYLQPAYGQTETSPLVTCSLHDDTIEEKEGSIGKALPHVQIRIWNCRDERESALDELGELQVKGYCVMQGYYNLPEETKKKFTADGWLRTGDIGTLDADGNFHFCHRAGETIIRGGENISPREIEECIGQYPGVTAVKVVGVTEEIIQEKVVALVSADGPAFNMEGLKGYLRINLARYKVPEEIFCISNMPMTASGKINQKEALRLATELCNRAQAQI